MNFINFLLIIMFITLYIFQMIMCFKIHIKNNTRNWTGKCDFIKLTFLPYVLFNLKKLDKFKQ